MNNRTILLAVTNENCTPQAKVREIYSPDDITGDEHLFSGDREELSEEAREIEKYAPEGAPGVYRRKEARNIIEYLKYIKE